MKGVRAYVFDVFGTVVDWRSGVARDAAPFLARHGAGHVDPGAFADAWRRRYAPAMEAVRSGLRPFVRLDVLHRENLDATVAEFGLVGRSMHKIDENVPVAELELLSDIYGDLLDRLLPQAGAAAAS